MPAHQTIERVIKPINEDSYRQSPIEEGFDWQTIVTSIDSIREHLAHKALYLVVFRSVQKQEVDADKQQIRSSLVATLDEAAHIEAKESDALIHYFAGELDLGRRALSWCLWTDKQAARVALSGPAHQEAVRHAPELYEDFTIELLDVALNEEDEIVITEQYHPRHNH